MRFYHHYLIIFSKLYLSPLSFFLSTLPVLSNTRTATQPDSSFILSYMINYVWDQYYVLLNFLIVALHFLLYTGFDLQIFQREFFFCHTNWNFYWVLAKFPFVMFFQAVPFQLHHYSFQDLTDFSIQNTFFSYYTFQQLICRISWILYVN